MEDSRRGNRWEIESPEAFVKNSGLANVREAQRDTPKQVWEKIEAGMKAAAMIEEGHSAAGIDGMRYRDGPVTRFFDETSLNPFASSRPILTREVEDAEKGYTSARIVDLHREVRIGALAMYQEVLLPEAARRLGAEIDASEMAKTRPLRDLPDVQFARLMAEHVQGMKESRTESVYTHIYDSRAPYQDGVVAHALRKHLGTDGIESRESWEGRVSPEEGKAIAEKANDMVGLYTSNPYTKSRFGVPEFGDMLPSIGEIIAVHEKERSQPNYDHRRPREASLAIAERDLATWPERYRELHEARLEAGAQRALQEGLSRNPEGVRGVDLPVSLAGRDSSRVFGRAKQGESEAAFEVAIKRGISTMTSPLVNDQGESRLSVSIASLVNSGRQAMEGGKALISGSKGPSAVEDRTVEQAMAARRGLSR